MNEQDMLALIQATAQKYNLPPDKFLAQLRAESNLRADAVSPRGAIGVGQIMPATAASLGIDPRDPAQNIDAAGRYMRMNLNQFGDNYDTALAAYNWGPGNVRKYGTANLPAETRAYIGKVSGATVTPDAAAPPPPPPAAPMPAPPPNLQPTMPQQVAGNYDPRMQSLADILLGMGRRTSTMNAVG